MTALNRQRWLAGVRAACVFVALVWLIHAVNVTQDLRFNDYGILPRVLEGLLGLPLWPFLHGSFYHLVSNTGPLLILGCLVALRGAGVFVTCTLTIILLGGLGVWLFGRQGVHIGASGLVFGYFGFLVAVGLVERSITSLAIASLTLFYYGGMIVGIIPASGYVSWEGHLFGMLAGALAARLHGKNLKWKE